jgi:hypothetical protein
MADRETGTKRFIDISFWTLAPLDFTSIGHAVKLLPRVWKLGVDVHIRKIIALCVRDAALVAKYSTRSDLLSLENVQQRDFFLRRHIVEIVCIR